MLDIYQSGKAIKIMTNDFIGISISVSPKRINENQKGKIIVRYLIDCFFIID